MHPGRRAGRAVIVITHDAELLAAACDRILRLEDGKIADASSAGLLG